MSYTPRFTQINIDEVTSGTGWNNACVSYPRKWVIVGDSRFERSSDEITNSSPNWNSIGPFSWVRCLSNGRFRMTPEDNYAQGGARTDSIVNDPLQLDAALAACDPGDGIIFNGGTNTFCKPITSIPLGVIPLSEVITNITDLHTKCMAKGVRLVIALPGARSYFTDSTDQIHMFLAYRRWALQWGETNGVKVMDFTRYSIDWAANPSQSLPFWLYDQLHQTFYGCIKEAQFYLRQLHEFLPDEQDSAIACSVVDLAPGTVTYPNPYGELLGSSMMAGTGGTIGGMLGGSVTMSTGIAAGQPGCTAGIADGWQLQYTGDAFYDLFDNPTQEEQDDPAFGLHDLTGTVIASKDIDPDGRPVQILQFQNIQGGGKREQFRLIKTVTNTNSLWGPGDEVCTIGRVSVRGPARCVDLQLTPANVVPFIGGTESHAPNAEAGIKIYISGNGITTGSVMTVTLTAAGVAGSPFVNSYTVQPGDDPETVITAWYTYFSGVAALAAAGHRFSVQDITNEDLSHTWGFRQLGPAPPAWYTMVLTSTGPETFLQTYPTGLFGNMLPATEPPVAGVWQTAWLTLPASVPTTSTMAKIVAIYIDTSLPATPENIVTVRLREISTIKKPIVVKDF